MTNPPDPASLWPEGAPLLLQIGTPEAHAALQSALEDADAVDTLPPFLAIQSIVTTEPYTAFDRLAPFIERYPAERTIVDGALRVFSPTGGYGASKWYVPIVPDVLRADHRWVQLAVRLRRDRHVGHSARDLLGSLSRKEIDEALRKTPPPPSTPTARYDGLTICWRDTREASTLPCGAGFAPQARSRNQACGRSRSPSRKPRCSGCDETWSGSRSAFGVRSTPSRPRPRGSRRSAASRDGSPASRRPAPLDDQGRRSLAELCEGLEPF